MNAAAAPDLGDRDFEKLRALVYQLTGIALGEGKRELVSSRLRRRLAALGLQSYGAYHDHVASGRDPAERTAFINAITTNKTDFFREPHHFQLLRKIAGEWKAAGRTRARIWSAGCSTGEEPYSIAIALHDLLPPGRFDLRIEATDIDTDVLTHARNGRYRPDRLDGTEQIRRFFEPDGDGLRARKELRDRIEFRQLNLMEGWPQREAFDLIFCRNVIIYFDRPTQERLLTRFSELLVSDGLLFLGHSESVMGLDAVYRLVGQTVYAKTDGARAAGPRAIAAAPTRVARPSPAPPTSRAPAPSPRVVASAPAAPPRIAPRPPVLGHNPAPLGKQARRPPAGPLVSTSMLRAMPVPHRRIVVGEAIACREATRLSTLLGSCVSACLWDPVAKVGGMNHFLLPESESDPTGSARYGVHAMELLINEVMKAGGDRRRFQAKLFGASHVLDVVASPVPKRNAAFAREFLATEGIPLAASRLGGDRPLEIHFFTEDGRALVREIAPTANAVRREEERAVAAAAPAPIVAGEIELWG